MEEAPRRSTKGQKPHCHVLRCRQDPEPEHPVEYSANTDPQRGKKRRGNVGCYLRAGTTRLCQNLKTSVPEYHKEGNHTHSSQDSFYDHMPNKSSGCSVCIKLCQSMNRQQQTRNRSSQFRSSIPYGY